METLKNLPERILHQREQDKEGATLGKHVDVSQHV